MKEDNHSVECKVVLVEPDHQYLKGTKVTLEGPDGQRTSINIPHEIWGDGNTYGLNLVFDHGGGSHYD